MLKVDIKNERVIRAKICKQNKSLNKRFKEAEAFFLILLQRFPKGVREKDCFERLIVIKAVFVQL